MDEVKEIQKSYELEGETLPLGALVLGGVVHRDAQISIPLSTLNRHGLVAGATGTGKTKTLQLIAGELSKAGVPVFLMDIKGDLSGLAEPGELGEKLKKRVEEVGQVFEPKGHPVEFLSLSEEPGVRLRATVTEFGPILLAKILGVNDTQSSVLSLIFKYAEDNKYPLVNLEDLKAMLAYGIDEIEKQYGFVSSASVSAILRRIVELEQQGGALFFGEPSFEVEDLLAPGRISIVRLTDIQNRPKLFSTFMLSLLSEVYQTLPEVGDLPKPKLVMMIDEAHLIFDEASKELLSQIETIVKLIRSKGVGILFCTQSPSDVPADILSQLGLKIQHSLRAFTALDRKKIKLVAENFPETKLYDVKNDITALGIGEAFVTALSEKGIPTPLVWTMLRAPDSRMSPLSEEELKRIVSRSSLVQKYAKSVDSESAKDLLQKRMEEAKAKKQERSSWFKFLNSGAAKTFSREIVRALLDVLGLGGKRR